MPDTDVENGVEVSQWVAWAFLDNAVVDERVAKNLQPAPMPDSRREIGRN